MMVLLISASIAIILGLNLFYSLQQKVPTKQMSKVLVILVINLAVLNVMNLNIEFYLVRLLLNAFVMMDFMIIKMKIVIYVIRNGCFFIK